MTTAALVLLAATPPAPGGGDRGLAGNVYTTAFSLIGVLPPCR
jgi:hypothetical protein